MCTGAEPVLMEAFAADAMAETAAASLWAGGDAAAMAAGEALGAGAAEWGAGAAAADWAVSSAGMEGFGMDLAGSIPAMDTLGSTGWFDSALNTFTNGGIDMGTAKSAMSLASPIMSIGSGLYGMSQADQMKKMAMLAGSRSDPWGASGGRGVADAQLQELLKNPGGVASKDPAYALRMQGAQRATATQGQNSGAMAVAGANASTDWYNQRLAQLGGISGATQNPAAGEQISMAGMTNANDLASKSLASIGYGVTRAGGAAVPPEVQMWLRSQGIAI
jgi:hypothetical protein